MGGDAGRGESPRTWSGARYTGLGHLGGIETPTDELNEQNYRTWMGRSLDDSLEHLATQHRELMRALQELTPAQIATGPTLPDDLQPFLRAPGVRHLWMHRKHIDAAVGSTTVGHPSIGGRR